MENASALGHVILGCQQNVNITLLRVKNHNDSDGDPADNQLLTQHRAQTVVDFLVAHGVDKNRLRPGRLCRRLTRCLTIRGSTARQPAHEFYIETINNGRPDGYIEPCKPNDFLYRH